MAGDVDAVLSEHGLAAGRHTLVLSYVDGPYRLALAEAALNVRQAFVWARAYITRYLPGQDAAQADIHVFARRGRGRPRPCLYRGPGRPPPLVGIRLGSRRRQRGSSGRNSRRGAVAAHDGRAERTARRVQSCGARVLVLRGLAGYVAAALATEPFLQLGPGERIDRAQLLAAVRLALRLPYHETVQVASDSTLVRARHIALADVPPGRGTTTTFRPCSKQDF